MQSKSNEKKNTKNSGRVGKIFPSIPGRIVGKEKVVPNDSQLATDDSGGRILRLREITRGFAVDQNVRDWVGKGDSDGVLMPSVFEKL